MAADRKKYQIVMRMRGMFPDEFGGYEMHRLRKGGRLRHVDKRFSKFNRRLHGSDTWARDALLEIAQMRDDGYSAEINGLTKRRRKSDLQARILEGPRDPWKNTRHGPMREIILTAHREWFGAERPDAWDGSLNHREAAFEKHAMDWLKTTFGDDLVHARADMDEEAYHIHAVVMPRATKKIAGQTCRVLKPSKYRVIGSYEFGQTHVAKHFAPLGLERGKKRAAANRAARESGREVEYRPHIPTGQYHAQRALELREEAERLEAAREDLDSREAGVSRRESDLDDRQVTVEAQAEAAAEKEKEVDAVLAVAEAVSAGIAEIEDSGDEPKLRRTKAAEQHPDGEAITKRIVASKKGRNRAVKAFASAWQTLRARARADAEAHFAREVESLNAARDAVSRIEGFIPKQFRQAFDEARRGLVKNLLALRKYDRTQEPRDGDEQN